MRDPDGQPLQVVMNFNQSLRGAAVGATVDFRGIVLGEVTNIGIDFDPKTKNFLMPVTMNVYPERLGRRFRETIESRANRPAARSSSGSSSTGCAASCAPATC